MTRYKPLILSLTAGLLASLAWTPYHGSILIITAFILFIHLFLVSVNNRLHHTTVFVRLIPGFLLFNILTFSWLSRVSVTGAVMAIMINAFMMSAVFWLSSEIYRRTSRLTALMTLIAIWLAYENLTQKIPVLSPWLNIGSVFGPDPWIVQWYEYTGIAGGSLWVLITATLFAVAVECYLTTEKVLNPYSLTAIAVLLIPIAFSLMVYFSYQDKGSETRIVIVQPNIDPFTEKFGSIPFIDQLNSMVKLASTQVSPVTDWILFPETAVDDPFVEEEAHDNRYIAMLNSFLADKPATSLLTGATTTRLFTERPDYRRNAAQKNDSVDGWFEIYNSAVAIHHGYSQLFYHKSRLVPGIESGIGAMPPLFEKMIPRLGGTMTGYGIQEERQIFTNPVTGSAIAPVICYESVFGSFVSETVSKGAGIICIITNDGWWLNSAGYRQHLAFASLRAIESRRSVARAANTGISCFTDQRGKIIAKSDWWVEQTLSATLKANNKITVYSIYGDLIYRYATFFALLVTILIFVGAPLKKLRP